MNRRNILTLISSFFSMALAKPAFAKRTPSATEGPFYPTGSMRFADADNNLVRITGLVRDAGGEIIILKGRVLDENGAPVEGAKVEIWQCDVNGVYLHTSSPNRDDYDQAFQGFGHVVTGADGAYAFRTIKPTEYPGRTPHIHVKAFVGNRELTTQFYLDNHPLNARDRIYGRLSETDRELVTMRFVEGPDGPQADVNILI